MSLPKRSDGFGEPGLSVVVDQYGDAAIQTWRRTGKKPRTGRNAWRGSLKELRAIGRTILALAPEVLAGDEEQLPKGATVPAFPEPGQRFVLGRKPWVFSRMGSAGFAILHPPGEPDLQSSIAIPLEELTRTPWRRSRGRRGSTP